MMATQFGKKMGAKVIAVSKQNWIKEFGADYIITEYDRVAEKVKDLTQGKMADVVLNSLGLQTWENSCICWSQWEMGDIWRSNRCRCEIKRSITLLKANKINWL